MFVDTTRLHLVVNLYYRFSFHGLVTYGYTGKTKCMEVGQHRGTMANEHIRTCSNSYVKVKTFKNLVSLLTNQDSTHEEIKCRLKAGN